MNHARGPAALLAALFLICCTALAAAATGFTDLQSKVREFRLANGITFLVLERHEAPVFSFRTYVDAGGVDEVAGITGIAHMFEHMAFKGTRTVGTVDLEAEELALARVDEAWDALAAERSRGARADAERVTKLEADFAAAEEAAREFVVSNEFSRILEEQGAQNLNAFTMMDATQYLYDLPSNRIELWARLEGDRLTYPVLREFYKERSVVQEERRLQESSPLGRAFATWWVASFLAHPYGNGLIGFPSDLEQITRRDAQAFFDRHYVGPNITIAIVGDVYFDEIRRLAETYFSGISAAPKPPPVRTVEPRHEAEIRVTIEDEAQPAVFAAYHIPASSHPDWAAYDLLGDILGQGRSGRFYERLVKQDGIAVDVGAYAGFPGSKYPCMLMFQAIVARDATTDQVEAALYQEIDRLVQDGPTAEELQKVKTMARASFIRSLRSNQGLAGQLAKFEEMDGDWRLLFGHLDRIDAVTTADIQRVAKESLRPGNRTVAVVRKPKTS